MRRANIVNPIPTEEATVGQAAQTAGLSQAEFLRELGRRRIPIHYGKEELEADFEAIESILPSVPAGHRPPWFGPRRAIRELAALLCSRKRDW